MADRDETKPGISIHVVRRLKRPADLEPAADEAPIEFDETEKKRPKRKKRPAEDADDEFVPGQRAVPIIGVN